MSKRAIAESLGVSCVFILLVSCIGSVPDMPDAHDPETADKSDNYIVLGDISDDPAEVIEGTQPLADYLASELSEYEITEGQVKIAATMEEMAQLLASGQVDLYFDSVYPATLVSDAADAQPILRRWRFGVAEYHSVIFASFDSEIGSVDELKGHIIAFDSPYSTSGYFLPAFHLAELGVNLVGKRSYNDFVGDDEVGFVFSYDDENTLQWVLRGLVAGGATDDYHMDVDFPADATNHLFVLARTDLVPRQVVVARGDIDPDLLKSIIQVLVQAHETEEGRAALEPFQTSKFDKFPEGIENAVNRMRDMMGIVETLPLPEQ